MELNREVLECMKSLRRRLRDELAVDIHLNQQNAISAMLGASQTSTDLDTQALGARLAELSQTAIPPRGQPFTPEVIESPTSNTATRVYRGQKIAF
jgi:hypothetical protein